MYHCFQALVKKWNRRKSKKYIQHHHQMILDLDCFTKYTGPTVSCQESNGDDIVQHLACTIPNQIFHLCCINFKSQIYSKLQSIFGIVKLADAFPEGSVLILEDLPISDSSHVTTFIEQVLKENEFFQHYFIIFACSSENNTTEILRFAIQEAQEMMQKELIIEV